MHGWVSFLRGGRLWTCWADVAENVNFGRSVGSKCTNIDFFFLSTMRRSTIFLYSACIQLHLFPVSQEQRPLSRTWTTYMRWDRRLAKFYLITLMITINWQNITPTTCWIFVAATNCVFFFLTEGPRTDVYMVATCICCNLTYNITTFVVTWLN